MKLQGLMSEQMVQLANVLFIMAVVMVLIAVIFLFAFDNRKKRKRKKKRRENIPPPVTVELAPRAIYHIDKTEVSKQDSDVDWQIVQDITFVHAKAITETEIDKIRK